MTPAPRHEEGYALVAAVASIALFGLLASTVLATTSRAFVSGSAHIDQAAAAAAAESGIAIALDGLVADDLIDNWSIGGRPRTLQVDGARVTVAIEDERGKVPLNLIEDKQVEDLIELLGYVGERGRVMRDSLLDWRDDDDEPRAYGAEAGFYRSRGIRPRNGSLVTIEELAQVRGFDAEAVAKLKRVASVDFGSGSFDTRYAQPLAIAVMYGGGEMSPEAIQRAREQAGQVTAFEFITARELVARPITIVAEARMPDGATARRACVVELTGADRRRYVIRSCEHR